MVTTNELVKRLLSHGGVEVPSLNDEDYLATLEAWLGLPCGGPEWERESMEESAPFEQSFYHSLESLLINIWKPEETSSSEPLMMHSNALLELDCLPKEASLYKAMESVRVTRLLRYWMDLNVSGNSVVLHDFATTEDMTSLSSILNDEHNAMSHTTKNDDETQPPKKVYLLLQALYHHIEQLPYLQAQLNFYTQSLMRGEKRASSNSGHTVTITESRLSQHMEAQQVSTKLNKEWQDHVDSLEYIIIEWYSLGSVDMRRQTRSHLGSVWSQFVARSGGGNAGVKMENTTSSGIQMTLKMLHRILKGTSSTLYKAHEHLLNYHLMPMHRPSSMVLWRDQTSLLELYHEPLVQCIAILLQKKPEWIPDVISSLTQPDVWTKGGNTPKLVLLLHEIDTYLGLLEDPSNNPCVLGEVFPKLLRLIGSCMASDHSRLAERALTFVQTPNFLRLIEGNFEESLRILLPYLVKNEPSWNPTVRKMTYNVLKILQEHDEVRFLKLADLCFPSSESVRSQSSKETGDVSTRTEGSAQSESKDPSVVQPKDFSLKSAMGGWKPPSKSSLRQRSSMPPPSSRAPRVPSAAPPLAVTGVAPWRKSSASPPLAVTGVAPWSKPCGSGPKGNGRPRGGKNPPLGVAGVAPWAVQKKSLTSVKRNAVEALSESSEESMGEAPKSRVLDFMKRIKPPEKEGGASAWSKAQMAETPTMLPTLKFHDLVFGHELGSGAFGSVKYARHIDKSRTRSEWPEYAVKIISTEKIREFGYEASVQRELAVMRILSHPGIARLISSFRFREGVYLVLEYASRGDLHSLLRSNGSLDHSSTRFVMGEVVAALSSIHDAGFVYGDLKPENIVITESGHIKLTDFGGCRPITDEASTLIDSVAKNLLKELRDGDWKSIKKIASSLPEEASWENNTDQSHTGDEIMVDSRIEGTTAYLPPEVVMGAFPTAAADSWALGCVIYQCLSGRPPIVEADESLTRNRIVSFDMKQTKNNQADALFGGAHGSGIENVARKLIVALLNRLSIERPNMNQVAEHQFFTGSNINVFSLYQKPAHPLDVGSVTPDEDAQWSRRQFSSIWAPQPQAYDVSIKPTDQKFFRSDSSNASILEGEEARSFFSASRYSMNNKRGSEKKAPIPLQTKRIDEE